ncbi:hypothetical protein HHK36_008755 [Tetracentron sinense]|uniref:Uncharacterized protein n=1 Tax=Tetracentron sinense TaxID=13715 RepID=A0A834ZJ57_TETSI|nr:hypothetical protein HHK36_008755 [Tetracentron sinense]
MRLTEARRGQDYCKHLSKIIGKTQNNLSDFNVLKVLFELLSSPFNSGLSPDYIPSSPQYSPSAGYSPTAPGYSPSSTSQYTPQLSNKDDSSAR